MRRTRKHLRKEMSKRGLKFIVFVQCLLFLSPTNLFKYIHYCCFLCSVDWPEAVKISTSGVGTGTPAVTAPGAFTFKLRENRNFGPPESYVWIKLLFDHVVSHFEFV